MNSKHARKKVPLWFWLPAMIGLVVAALAWWMMGLYIEKKVAEQPRLPPLPVEELQVIVPKENLKTGTLIEAHHLAVRRLPAKALPADVIYPSEAETLLGQVVVADLKQGKALQLLHLRTINKNALSERIGRGYTAFTLDIDPLWTHGQQIKRGDRFDFYDASSGNWKRILSSVPLLMFSPQPTEYEQEMKMSDSFTHATFEVPIEEYARLTVLQQQQQLVPMLQSVEHTTGPERLKIPQVPEIIYPGSGEQINEEWP